MFARRGVDGGVGGHVEGGAGDRLPFAEGCQAGCVVKVALDDPVTEHSLDDVLVRLCRKQAEDVGGVASILQC